MRGMNKMDKEFDRFINNPKQKEWDEQYISFCNQLASKSKCVAKQVACILVRDSNILAIGINGTFPHAKNCNDLFFSVTNDDPFGNKSDFFYETYHTHYNRKDNADISLPENQHHEWSLIHEVHAEINALAKANKNGTCVVGATAYISYSPCFNCAKTLYTFGIKRIVYNKEYDDINNVKKLLSDFDITLERFVKI